MKAASILRMVMLLVFLLTCPSSLEADLGGADVVDKESARPEMPLAKAVPMRPHLLVTAEKIDGLLSLAELRTAIKSGHSKKLWETMLALADADVSSDPIPGGPRDWADVHAAGIRLLRLSLTSLVLGEPAGHPYRDAALEQLDCLFDPDCGWPNWHSGWHLSSGVNEKEFWIRHGMFCRDIGLAYDWLYSSLTPAQRQTIIDGLNVYVFPQYHFSAAGGGYAGAFNRRDNIKANNLGGAAILGMSLGQDHSDSQYLVDMAGDPSYNKYSESFGRMPHHVYDNGVYGPEGSPNESVGYSNGAIRGLVIYFDTHYYHESVLAGVAGQNPLGKWPFPEYSRWQMYMTSPPGRQACIGNGFVEAKTLISQTPAVAAASGDGILQWFYQNNLDHKNIPGVNEKDWEKTDKSRLYWYELLRYDPSLAPASPEGQMPHGRIFTKAVWPSWVPLSSRTDWNQETTASVVYGRAGPAFYSDGNYDAGQVCIDGYRQRLIIDQGYRRPLKYHNLLMFDEQNMTFNSESFEFSKILRADFDDNRGGYWAVDTANCYGGVADHVQRTVVHLHPGIVVVHDEAVIDQPRNISLRWHTISAAAPDEGGRFTVSGGDDVNLACRVMRLDEGQMRLIQREEEEVEATESKMTDSKCRILSLFSVFAPGVKPNDWHDNGKLISIATPEGRVDVAVTESELTVSNRGTGLSWSVPLDGTVPLKRF